MASRISLKRQLALRQWPGGLCSRGKSLPRQVIPFLIHWAAVPQLGDVAAWPVLLWINMFRVVQLREPLGLAADGLW